MKLPLRAKQILVYLVQKRDFITAEEGQTKWGISRRTFYYHLQKIDQWLESKRLEPTLRIYGSGRKLPEKTRQKLLTSYSSSLQTKKSLSVEQRLSSIFLAICSCLSEIFPHDLLSITGTSRSTLFQDLQKLKNGLQKEEIHFSYHHSIGYRVTGAEKSIRHQISRSVSTILQHEKQELLQQILFQCGKGTPSPSKMENLFRQLEHRLKAQYTDEVVEHLSYTFCFFWTRMMQKHTLGELEVSSDRTITNTPEYEAVHWMFHQLDFPDNLHASSSEIAYFTTLLLGAKMTHFPEGGTSLITKEDVMEMIDRFEQLTRIEFEDRSRLFQNLTLHLRSAIYRIRFQMEATGKSIAQEVKEQYPDVYRFTAIAVEGLETKWNIRFSAEEIAYIAVHFLGWMKKEAKKLSTKPQVVIVCSNGVGTSQMLLQRLEHFFPEINIQQILSVRKYEKIEVEADLIVATKPIVEKRIPVVVVSPLLTKDERLEIANKLGISTFPLHHSYIPELMEIIREHARIVDEEGLYRDLKNYFGLRKPKNEPESSSLPALAQLLPMNRLVFRKRVSSWQDAIQIAAAPLAKQRMIHHKYIDAMIRTVSQKGPYIMIAPGIALAHARPEDGVITTGFSLLVLQEAVSFSMEREPVSLLFVLAAENQTSHLRGLRELNDLLTSPHFTEKLTFVSDLEELQKVWRQTIFSERT